MATATGLPMRPSSSRWQLLGYFFVTDPLYQAEFWKDSIKAARPWVAEIREGLPAQLPRFHSLEQNGDKDISDTAREIISKMS